MADGAGVAGHGLAVRLPSRWEARLYLRDRPGDTSGVRPDRPLLAAVTHPAAYGWAGESPNPVLHLANFALPPGRGDFGTGAVEIMRAEHVFVALLEYDRQEAGRPLFEYQGVPRPALGDFAANQLQRRLPGQLGTQQFFTHRDRAFCLYAVLGSRRHAPELVRSLHSVLDTLEVDARGDLAV